MNPSDLQKWRQQHGYTLKELAEKLDVALNTVWRWEKGKREIPSFLHLALECMEKKGGEKKRGMKTEKKGVKKSERKHSKKR